HPLLLAPRELVGVAVAEAAEADAVEQLLALAGPLGRRHLADLEGKLDVLPHAHVAEDRVVLEDEADPPLLGRQAGDVLVAQPDAPAVRRREPGRHAQDGALAAAAGAQEDE